MAKCEHKRQSSQPSNEEHSPLRGTEDIPESDRKQTMIPAPWLCSETICVAIINVLSMGFPLSSSWNYLIMKGNKCYSKKSKNYRPWPQKRKAKAERWERGSWVRRGESTDGLLTLPGTCHGWSWDRKWRLRHASWIGKEYQWKPWKVSSNYNGK